MNEAREPARTLLRYPARNPSEGTRMRSILLLLLGVPLPLVLLVAFCTHHL
jgi:hypothetical protein